MAADYGSDFSCVDDLDANLSQVSGDLGLVQAVARRWLCPAGGLWYDPTYGYGLLRHVGVSAPRLRAIAGGLTAEALKDERVLRCDAFPTFDATTRTITIRATIYGQQADSYTFTLLVGPGLVELLEAA